MLLLHFTNSGIRKLKSYMVFLITSYPKFQKYCYSEIDLSVHSIFLNFQKMIIICFIHCTILFMDESEQELSPILVPTPSEITELLQSTQVGQFAAMKLKKYNDEIPQIGKVKNVREKEIQVEWWIGRWNNTWRMWKTRGAVNKYFCNFFKKIV